MGPYSGGPRAASGEPKTNSAGPGLRSLRRLWRGGAFALCARGDGDRLQGSLRTDPAPLGVFWRSAGSGLRSLRRLGGGGAFARCARGVGDRLQGSLRPDPAAAGTVLCGRQSLRVSQQQRSSISWTPAAWKRGFPSSARTARVSMAKRSPKRLSIVGASTDQGGPAMRDWS